MSKIIANPSNIAAFKHKYINTVFGTFAAEMSVAKEPRRRKRSEGACSASPASSPPRTLQQVWRQAGEGKMRQHHHDAGHQPIEQTAILLLKSRQTTAPPEQRLIHSHHGIIGALAGAHLEGRARQQGGRTLLSKHQRGIIPIALTRNLSLGRKGCTAPTHHGSQQSAAI